MPVSQTRRQVPLALNTVARGRNELRAGAKADDLVNVRRKGAGGRKSHVEVHPELLPALKRLVDPATRGDPESGLRWSREERCRFVARAVRRARHPGERQDRRQTARSTWLQPSGCEEDGRVAGSTRIATLSSSTSLRRRSAASSKACRSSPSIRRKRSWSATSRTPVASGSRRTRRSSSTCTIFPATRSARRSRTASTTSRTTAASSMSAPTMTHRSSRSFRSKRGGSGCGRKRYPDATELFITADAGGSNSYRARVWKFELQRLADKAPPADPRQPSSSGNEQVEQDRAPPVLVHHDELARQTTPHLRDRGEPDRQHHEQRWPRGERHDRPSSVPDREEKLRRNR